MRMIKSFVHRTRLPYANPSLSAAISIRGNCRGPSAGQREREKERERGSLNTRSLCGLLRIIKSSFGDAQAGGTLIYRASAAVIKFIPFQL